MASDRDQSKLDRITAQAIAYKQEREQGYRQRALKLYPWICGRCAREFTRQTVHELTVHHKDHNHDNNPPDGSNWELLCLYCHDNEHSRHEEWVQYGDSGNKHSAEATHNPFAGLRDMLGKK